MTYFVCWRKIKIFKCVRLAMELPGEIPTFQGSRAIFNRQHSCFRNKLASMPSVFTQVCSHGCCKNQLGRCTPGILLCPKTACKKLNCCIFRCQNIISCG